MKVVRVPNNEPGLVNPRRNEDGTLNERDLEKLRNVYSIIGRTPTRVLRIRERINDVSPAPTEPVVPPTEPLISPTYTGDNKSSA